MKKIVLNRCYGGFEISNEAIEELLKRKGIKFKKGINKFDNVIFLDENDKEIDFFRYENINLRTDKDLIKLIEEKGSNFVSGFLSRLEIVKVQEGKKFIIDDYDGFEGIIYEDDFDWIIL